MKKRLLLVFALVMCSILLLCACSDFDRSEMKKDLKVDELEAIQLAGLKDYTYADSAADLAMFTQENADNVTYKVMQISTGKEVFSKTLQSGETLSFFDGSALILYTKEKEDSTQTHSVYSITEKGKYNELCTNVKKAEIVNDCLVYDDVNVVRFDEKTGEQKQKVYTRSEFDGAIPECLDWTDNYYYTADGYTIYIYDNHYIRTAIYSVPSYVENMHWWVLDDDSIIVQGRTKLDDQAEAYDLLTEASGKFNKYEITTVRVDPDSGKAKKLNADFLIQNMKRGDSIPAIVKDSVKNFAKVQKIENQRLNDAYCYMSLNSHLKGGEILTFNGEAALPESFGNGYAAATGSVTGTEYLLSSNGKVLAHLDAVKNYSVKYILTDNGIYDYKLKLLQSLTDEEYRNYECVGSVGSALIFKKTDGETVTYYRFGKFGKDKEAGFSKIATGENWADDMGFCYILTQLTEEGQEWSYYDASGNKLFTSKGVEAAIRAYSDQCLLFEIGTSDGSAYYRVRLSK